MKQTDTIQAAGFNSHPDDLLKTLQAEAEKRGAAITDTETLTKQTSHGMAVLMIAWIEWEDGGPEPVGMLNLERLSENLPDLRRVIDPAPGTATFLENPPFAEVSA